MLGLEYRWARNAARRVAMKEFAIALVLLVTLGACQKAPLPQKSQPQPIVAVSAGSAMQSAGKPVASAPIASAPSVLAAEPMAGNLCAKLCERSAPLHCKAGAECGQHCQQMIAIPACRAEMLTSLRCFASQPSQNWECDADGLPSIKEGLCDAEQERYTNCMQSRQ
jgi:hypothetical protein